MHANCGDPWLSVLQRPTRRIKSLPTSPPPTTSTACFRVRGLRTLAISSNQFIYPTPADDTFSLFICLMYANCGERNALGRPPEPSRVFQGTLGCPGTSRTARASSRTFSNAVSQQSTRRIKTLPASPPPTTSTACFQVRGLRTLATSSKTSSSVPHQRMIPLAGSFV